MRMRIDVGDRRLHSARARPSAASAATRGPRPNGRLWPVAATQASSSTIATSGGACFASLSSNSVGTQRPSAPELTLGSMMLRYCGIGQRLPRFSASVSSAALSRSRSRGGTASAE